MRLTLTLRLMPQADKPAETEKADDPLRHFWPSVEIDARVLSGRFCWAERLVAILLSICELEKRCADKSAQRGFAF